MQHNKWNSTEERKPNPNDRCFFTYGVDEEVYPCNARREHHELSHNHDFVLGMPRQTLKRLSNKIAAMLQEEIY